MLSGRKKSIFLLSVAVALLALVLACGEEATPTAAPPTAAPAASAADIASEVQRAVEQAMRAEEAQEAASAEDIQSMVASAIANAQQGVSEQDLEAIVARAVESAMAEEDVVVAATPAPVTPAPTPTPGPAAPLKVEPQGILDVGHPELGVMIFVLKNQPYQAFRFTNTMGTHETFFAQSPEGDQIARLVHDWDFEETTDGATYTFHLQEGVKWHDTYGDWGEFNVDDILFSIENISSEGTPHAAAGGIRRIFGCDECQLTKIDDLTLELKRPSPTFEITWHVKHPTESVMSVHSKSHYDTVGEDTANLQPVGTGPWQVVDFRADERIRMEGVRDHWRRTPEWDQMVWHGILEESTRFANFLTGQLDTGKFTLESVAAIKDEALPDVKFMTLPGSVLEYVVITGQQYNLDHPSHLPDAEGKVRVPLGDDPFDCSVPWVSCERAVDSAEWQQALMVRRAMSLAIDRQKLVNNLAFGEGRPRSVVFWTGHDTRFKQLGLDKLVYPFDLDEARSLLAEAGYPDGFEIDMTLALRAIEQAKSVCTMWEAINVSCVQRQVNFGSYRPTLVSRVAKGTWGLNVAPQIEPLWIMGLFHDSNNSLNVGFEHPDFQALLDEANTLIDDDARFAKQAEISRWIFDNVMLLPTYEAAAVWPLGLEVDEWAQMAGSPILLSNWEDVPHRK